MKRLISLLLLIITVIACQRDPRPREALKTEKYIDILVDVHIAEAIYNDRKHLKIDSLKSEELYLSVLKKHEVTEEQMLITAMYYSRNQREYKKVWTEVLDRFSILIEEQDEKEKMKIESDSIPVPVNEKIRK